MITCDYLWLLVANYDIYTRLMVIRQQLTNSQFVRNIKHPFWSKIIIHYIIFATLFIVTCVETCC